MVDRLVEELQRANWLYHNTDNLSMTDDEFDRGLEELRRLSPAHPFLSLVGAAAVKGSLLPYVMGSLDKIRYGEASLDRWKKRMSLAGVKSYLITEKLDGISALYVSQGGKRSLYLRGDGVKGVDISSLIGPLGLVQSGSDFAIRGELVLPTAATPEGSIGRSLINGWVHRSAVKELAAVHFVAYQVFQPAGLMRKEQSAWLDEHGFKKPWTRIVAAPGLAEELAKDILVTRRRSSEYPLDGIVIGADCVPATVGGGEARNPTDCIAFKASLDEQKQQTTVIGVEWNASRQGCLIPRIQIEPVTIGGANIQWLSGHNAGLIHKNGIGPGARIIIRRSGDVIPTLDSVLTPVTASMPEGTWAWDDNQTHAMATVAQESILHAFQTLGIESVGPGLCDKLVAAGLNTMALVWKASAARLGEIIGAGRGPALYENLRVCMAKATQMQLLIASNMLPRGVGERKLRLLYAIAPDASNWAVLSKEKGVAGWSEGSLAELLTVLPAALAWSVPFSSPGASSSTPKAQTAPATSAATPTPTLTKFVVFTGVRDKVLEGTIAAKGWSVDAAVTKKTTVLVVADSEADAPSGLKETGKVKKAREAGVRIMRISEFRTFVLAN
jgi:DNA ligase (NAD+)